MNFAKFEIKYFNILDNTTQKIIKDYYYWYKYWIGYNFSPNKNHITVILKTIKANQNDEKVIKQIK